MAALLPAATKERMVVWFKNDLRIHDHPILVEVARSLLSRPPVTTTTTVTPSPAAQKDLICVYCFDPRFFGRTTPYGSHKTQIFRAQFLLQSVANLRKNLRSLGSDLLVTCQRPEDFIPRLFDSNRSYDPAQSAVYVSHEVTTEEESIERAVEKELQKKQISLRRFEAVNALYHPSDLPYAKPSYGDLPNTFTIFRERVEKECRIRPLLPTPERLPSGPSEETLRAETDFITAATTASFSFLPTLQQLGFSDEEVHHFTSETHLKSRGVMTFIGGEDAAKARIQQWMFRDNRLKDYFQIRNGMLGEDYSSKLSPWLANGCVSPKYIYTEVKRYERETRISNKSTYWLVFELLWRDFFYYFAQKYKERLFYPSGVLLSNRSRKKWQYDAELIEKWKLGRTGIPLVDANMRELLASGWMSNRGRQNVASYLVYDLQQDWRIGADHFESYLLDYDVCSNYGNWQAAAGLTGGRRNQFNVIKQSYDYDPRGEYIKYWLPELAKLPVPFVFEPWKLSPEEQLRYGVKIGNDPDSDYPLPVDSRKWEGYRYDQEVSQSQRKNWGAHYDTPRGGSDRDQSRSNLSLGDFVVKKEKNHHKKKK